MLKLSSVVVCQPSCLGIFIEPWDVFVLCRFGNSEGSIIFFNLICSWCCLERRKTGKGKIDFPHIDLAEFGVDVTSNR